jgi:hypothetical protein
VGKYRPTAATLVAERAGIPQVSTWTYIALRDALALNLCAFTDLRLRISLTVLVGVLKLVQLHEASKYFFEHKHHSFQRAL